MRDADIAMYEAKAAGKRRGVLFSGSHRAAAGVPRSALDRATVAPSVS